MLSEIECRALSYVKNILLQDFEPKDALMYFKNNQNTFSDEDCTSIRETQTRADRISVFLHIFRRKGNTINDLLDFFDYNSQKHISNELETFFEKLGEEEEEEETYCGSPFDEMILRQAHERVLLMGGVPRRSDSYNRKEVVDEIMHKLCDLSVLDSFFLIVHGRAGAGKTEATALALAANRNLFGELSKRHEFDDSGDSYFRLGIKPYNSVIWVRDGSTQPKDTFSVFANVLLMLRADDIRENYPVVDNVTTMVLKRMIANALIDRPNTLFVFDDVVLEDTLRWAQELRLRCLITTRDVDLANVATVTCDFVEVPPLEYKECLDYLESFGMESPTTAEEYKMVEEVFQKSSGNMAVLAILVKQCDRTSLSRLCQLTSRLEKRGFSSIESRTPYLFKTFDAALTRCIEIMSEEDQSRLAYTVVMPPGIPIPLSIWSAIIPVDTCGIEEDEIDEEVLGKLDKFARRGEFVRRVEQNGVCCFQIDTIVHIMLRHAVDSRIITEGINLLKNKLLEYHSNNNRSPRRNRDGGVEVGEDYCGHQESESSDMDNIYDEFMIKYEPFFSSLKEFAK